MSSVKFDSIGVFQFEPNLLTQRQKSILLHLKDSYGKDETQSVLLQMVNQTSEISLRALDWLVTNFSKKYNIVCYAQDGSLFNIFHSYKVALTHFRRRNFDPFRRRQRIYIDVNGTHVVTTVGQCNFLHWAMVNGVLQYAYAHAESIEQDMNSAACLQKIEKKKNIMNGIPRRRSELSKAPRTKCSVYRIDTQMSFALK